MFTAQAAVALREAQRRKGMAYQGQPRRRGRPHVQNPFQSGFKWRPFVGLGVALGTAGWSE